MQPWRHARFQAFILDVAFDGLFEPRLIAGRLPNGDNQFSETDLMNPLLAYLDAGSGSMLLQALVAGVAGLIVACKFFFQSSLLKLRGRREQPEQSSGVGQESGQPGQPETNADNPAS